jgi:hypothetical protein
MDARLHGLRRVQSLEKGYERPMGVLDDDERA